MFSVYSVSPSSAIKMNSVWALLALASVAVVGVQGASKCPMVACTLEYYTNKLHLPSLIVYEKEICNLCNKWMDKEPTLKEDGCPVVPCTRQAIRPGCARQSYFVWEDKLCPDCIKEYC